MNEKFIYCKKYQTLIKNYSLDYIIIITFMYRNVLLKVKNIFIIVAGYEKL